MRYILWLIAFSLSAAISEGRTRWAHGGHRDRDGQNTGHSHNKRLTHVSCWQKTPGFDDLFEGSFWSPTLTLEDCADFCDDLGPFGVSVENNCKCGGVGDTRSQLTRLG